MRHPTSNYALPLLLTVLLVPACSSAADSADSARSRPVSSPAKTTAPKTTPPTTSGPPPLTAANGTDVKACRDSDCEIVLDGPADFPLNPKFGFTGFTLTHSKPNEVSFEVERTEYGDSYGYIKGTGELGFANGVTITVRKIDATGAVVRFEPRTVDPDNDVARGSEGAAFYSSS